MKKAVIIMIAFLFSLSLFACVREATTGDGATDTEPVSAVTPPKETVKDTTSANTTSAVTTEEVTTEEVTTEALTTDFETTSPPVTTAPPVIAPPETEYYPPVLRDPSRITYPVSYNGYTFTGLATLSPVEYTVYDPENSRGISEVRHAFSYGVARDGAPHSITVNNQATFDGYGTNGLAWDNKSSEKVLYLTFDCGYKYGDLTGRILDTLKEKEVKAAFFCTMDYLETDPEEIARMIAEGHTVGNHSVTHPDCTTVSREKLAWELLGVHNYMRVNFGYTPEYFRFPTGAFSEDSLELVNSMGYKSVFWSVAYADWDPENQQGTDVAYSQVTSRLHPGAVILLHSTSPDNAAILADVIDYAHGCGYVFKTLDEYGYWN